MTLFIIPGPVCSESYKFKTLGSNLSQSHMRPGATCAASDYKNKNLSLIDEVALSPLKFTNGQMCRRDNYLNENNPLIEKEKKVSVAVIVGGFTNTNPFGHVAIAIEGHGTYSFGTKTVPGEGLRSYLAKQGEYRSSVVYSIETTEAKAKAILQTIKSFVGKPLPDPTKDPRGFADTCATRTIKALEAGGFKNPKPTLFGTSPSMFPRDAANYGREYGKSTQLEKGMSVPDIFEKFDKKE